MSHANISIAVQPEPFDTGEMYHQLSQCTPSPGAVVTFTGLVRDLDNDKNIIALELEHYPGMTEKSLQTIAQQAASKWPIQAISLVHRIGRLEAGHPIVAVGVASAHRVAAFNACEFIMDYLKNDAPFWKKEIRTDGEQWVASKQSDVAAKHRWQD
ncbi:molybdopterin synthase catalytic subunit MoaE [Halioxenophilus aromaticivorans]|uniref:Molybdopterin synthase catalytic subunit n=1 Tax=Halioxenophilus aromaticivorans TaxID=1306992 RepID=A0AAV3TYS8_9ALTE